MSERQRSSPLWLQVACREWDQLGDTSTLADPAILDVLVRKVTALYAPAK